MGHRVYMRGDVDVFPAGSTCAWMDDDSVTSISIALAPALIDRAAARNRRPPTIAARHKVRDARIEQIAWALASEVASGNLHGASYLEGLGLALAAYLLAPPRDASMRAPTLDAARLAALSAIIEARLDASLSIPRLAREVDLSPTHLKRLFRATVGLPLHAYIVQRRVDRAKYLLEQKDMPIAEVAAAVGFAHQSHMSRWLRRLLGTTPLRIRHGRPPTAR
jgi:AraC family transcriptional regulator